MKVLKINKKIRYIPEKKLIISSNIDLDDTCWDEFIKNYVNDVSEDKPQIISTKYFKYENSFPTTAGILLTNKCPLKCSYCFYNSGEGDNTTLDRSKINVFVKTLIKNAIMTKLIEKEYTPTVKIVLSGGGEPTADFDLLKYCVCTIKSLCSEAGIGSSIHLVTNGVITREVAKYIVDNIDSCNISFDGLPTLQNIQRPMGNGKESIEYVLNTASLFDDMNYHYGIRTTITNENYREMTRMADYIYTTFKNMYQWQIEPVYSGGRAEAMDFSKLDEFGNYFRELTEYSIDKYGKYPLNSGMTYKLISKYCNTSIGTNYWLDAYGDIIPCAEHFDKDRYRFAHFCDNEIVVDENEHDRLFEDYELRKDMCCADCVAVYHCAGGCPMRMVRNEKGEFINQYGKYSCLSIKKYWIDAITNLSKCNRFSEMIPELHGRVSYKGSTLKIINIRSLGE